MKKIEHLDRYYLVNELKHEKTTEQTTAFKSTNTWITQYYF